MTKLKINNFKCFKDIDIELRPLTIMAGGNGNGKSTAIHALLYLRHSIESLFKLFEGYYVSEKPDINQDIALNDKFLLSLGNSGYVINRNANKEEILIGITDTEDDFVMTYLADSYQPRLYLTASKCSGYNASKHSIFKADFYYLNAERIGPRLTQRVQFFTYPNAGWQGEYVAQLISERSGYLPIEDDRLFPGTTNPGIEFQVNEWLNFIMPGVRVSVRNNPETFTAQIQIENIYTKGDPTVATNIGFGISYVLPIIATGLIANKNAYFIVENPEAHLHPSAQSKVALFLAMVANSGVNVILETHSDHVINGIQIAVAEKKIDSTQVGINFFDQDPQTDQPVVNVIGITAKGELSEWPNGFFDQSQIDYAKLFRLRKT
ncbi:AAA family ATPase [Flavobacterium sp.]|uniref:AAA family ATPase n=1 Tax=Flavobacterium sp. TaxID=239 RepID=UPI004034B12D